MDRHTTGSQTGPVTVRLIALSLRQVLRLLLLTCRSSRSKDLELLVLRQEIAVLRRQVPHPKTTREERLVLTVLQRLRPVRERLSNLFTPDTLRRWHRELVRKKWEVPHRIKQRTTIPLQTQLLVWRMSRENPMWGYRRIQGELQKIGIDISATSIRRILAPRRRPGPKRDTWRQFVVSQASSIVACDLFTVESVKLTTLHVLFFIELHTRRVLIGGVTDGSANLAWATQIARNLSAAREDRKEPIRFLVHDRDKRFGATFDEVFKAEGIKIVRTPWRAPKANAYAERWIRTVRTECLDRVMILGPRHLEHLLTTYVKHYNEERPHRSLGLEPPGGAQPVRALSPHPSELGRRDLLGGLIHEYYRKAA
jgi:transposase InsO family protein